MTHPASPAADLDINGDLRVALTIVEQMLRGAGTREMGRAMARRLFRLNKVVAEFLFESYVHVSIAAATEVLTDDVVRALVRVAAVFTERDRSWATIEFKHGYMRQLDGEAPQADWALGMVVGWAAAKAEAGVPDDARAWHRENPEEAAVGAARDWREGKLEVGEVA